MTEYSEKTLSVIIFLAAALWGLFWVPLRYLETVGLIDAWAAAVFNLCPLVLLLPYLLWQGGWAKGKTGQILLIGFLSGTGLSFYATGIVASSVIRTTMLFYLTPVWSTVIGYFWLSENLTRGRIAAILLGLVGLFLLLSNTRDDTIPLNIGDLLALFSGLFWGFAAACLKRWPNTPVVATTTVQFGFAALVSLCLGALIFSASLPTVAIVWASLPVAFFTSAGVLMPTVFFIFWVSQRLFPGRVAILMMSEVLVAVLSASLFLPDEALTILQWLGAGLILAACLCEVSWKGEVEAVI